MKQTIQLFSIFIILCVFFACKSETKKEAKVDPIAFEKAFNENMDLDYNFVDTIIKYELTEKEILLDFGAPDDNRWVVAVIFNKPDGSEVTTKIGLSYFLEDGKLSLPYPEGINSKNDANNFYIIASPAGKLFISEYPQLDYREIELFNYRPIRKGILKPTGDDWYAMKDIIYKYNYMQSHKYSIEMMDAIDKKKNQLVNKVRSRYR